MPHGIGVNRFDDGEKVKIKKSVMKRLLKYAAPYWYYLVGALLLILVYTLLDIIRPSIEGNAIDTFMTGAANGTLTKTEALEGIKRMALIYAGLIALQFFLNFAREYTLRLTGQSIIKSLRNAIFEKVQRLPLSYFDKNPDGVIVTRINNDPQALNEFFSHVLVGFAQNILIMLGVLIAMFVHNSTMALYSIAVLPLMVVITFVVQRVARKIFLNIRTKLAKIMAFLDENISGIKIIRAFSMEHKKIKEFGMLNKEYYKANMKMVIFFGVFRPLMDFVRYLALAILLYFGGINIIDGAITVGTLYIFIKYINMFFEPLMAMADQFNMLQSSMAASEKIFNLMDQEEELNPDSPDTLPKERIGKVEFKNVWFAYVGENWVLKDVSFTVEPGQSVAFIGATGAGKTSIISLLCGFYEIQKGTIYLDGKDISKISKAELRSRIGLVLQDVFLMKGDIITNIKLYDSSLSDEEVIEIARYLQADEFVQRLPDKYYHKLSSGGTTLSSGERQLLSFARALCQDPEILIMDEATANIDTHTEKLVQESLERLQKGRTSISIAHRLSTIKNADVIIALEKGEIAEKGNHETLMAKKGLYYDLVQLQS